MSFKTKYIYLFVIIFFFLFCYSYFISAVYGDEIWNYGFAYNIASGLVPYKDFNLVVTPLYAFLSSFFIKIFGHHLYSLHIFNCLILTLLLMLCYIKLGKKSFLLISFIILNGYPSYNILCVFIIILLLFLSSYKFKYDDIVSSLLISLLFLTKQTIGISLIIPLIYYSKNKIKSFICFLIPIFIFVVYLLSNNAFYEFIDYCILGLLNFGNSNSVYLFLPLEIIICLILLFLLIKSKFNNKDLFYILMFQIITIPIVDDYHFMLGLIPVLYYFFSEINIVNYKIKYYFIMCVSFCLIWNSYVRSHKIGHLYSDNESYLYGRNIPKYIEDTVTNVSDYIKDNTDNFDYIYLFSANSYWIKLNVEYPISKFDLINNGNMGYNGSVKYIKEIDGYCDINKCMFILYQYEFREKNISQTSKELVDYVKNNYFILESIDSFDIYKNN